MTLAVMSTDSPTRPSAIPAKRSVLKRKIARSPDSEELPKVEQSKPVATPAPRKSKKRRRGPRGRRTQARELTLQALYQSEIGGEQSVDAAIVQLSEAASASKVDIEFFQELTRGVWSQRAELDERMAQFIKRWSVDRVAVIDRNVLRVGLYELTAGPAAPAKVVINEAIELSKRYGGEESSRFVNGVMDHMAAHVRKGGILDSE